MVHSYGKESGDKVRKYVFSEMADEVLEQMEYLRKCHVEMWGWLADNPGKDKHDWPVFDAAVSGILSADARQTAEDAQCFACGARVLLLTYVQKRCQNAPTTDGKQPATLYGVALTGCNLCPLWRAADTVVGFRFIYTPTVREKYVCLSELYARWRGGEHALAAVIRDLGWVSDPFTPASLATEQVTATERCPKCEKGLTKDCPSGEYCIGDSSLGIRSCGWLSWRN